MASTYSDLKIELIGTGEQTGTWGTTTNNNFSIAIGEAITGSADVAFSSADVTLTLTDTNAAQAARNLRLNLTGTSGGARNLILGSGCQIEKLYLINNGLADAVTVKNTGGTGIAVPAGKTMFVYNNGTNVVEATSGDIFGPASSTDNAVARFDGTTGKAIQNSVVTIADSTGDMAGVGTLSSGAITTTGVLTLPAGTVSLPAITTTGDTNTGIFFPAADTIAFTEGGVESMRIDSDGDVGIGATSISRKLQISQSNATTYTGDFDASPNQLYIVNTNTTTNAYTGLQMDVGSNSQAAISAIRTGDGEVAMAFGTRVAGVRAERMRIDSSGNVGIGTTTVEAKLDIRGMTGASTSAFLIGYGANGDNYYTCGSSGIQVFRSANTERMRIDSSGRLLINTTTARTTLTGDRSALVQLEAQSVDQFLSIFRNENNAFGSAIWLGKSRGTTAGSNTTVQSGDTLASLVFLGANGTDTQQAANIAVQATGTISASAMPGIMIFSTTGAGSNIPTERMRITSAGNVLVGASTVGLENGGIQSQPNGNTTNVPFFGCAGNSSSSAYVCYGLYSTSLSQYQFYVDYSGVISARSATITNLSDVREKTNIKDLETGLAEVLQLKPKRYDWKDNSNTNMVGFIAQEVLEVLPDLVGNYRVKEGQEPRLSLRTGDILPTLVKAIQELNAKVEAQTAEIALLKSK